MERSTSSTTPTPETPRLSADDRAARLLLLADRLSRPDGLDRDILARIELLTGDER